MKRLRKRKKNEGEKKREFYTYLQKLVKLRFGGQHKQRFGGQHKQRFGGQHKDVTHPTLS